MKADMGPGPFDANFRATILQSFGFYFFAGLSNGTELGHEIYQLFAYEKSAMEVNGAELWKAPYTFLRQKAKANTWDLLLIVLGGNIKLANGAVLELQNGFIMAFTNLPEQDQTDILNGWKDYSLDNNYSQSIV